MTYTSPRTPGTGVHPGIAMGGAVVALIGGLWAGRYSAPPAEPIVTAPRAPVKIGPARTRALPDPNLTPGAIDAAVTQAIPDPKLTPGVAIPGVTAAQVCVPGYSAGVRNVPAQEKAQVYAEYGIKTHKAGDFEIDHDVSLELGGSNAIGNLWAQSYRTSPWNAHLKDRLEDKLHQLVCTEVIPLTQAQREIEGDWTVAYRKYLGAPE